MAVIAKGMDVVDFAAVVYNHVYDKAIEAEHRAGGKDKDGNIRGSKAGIYILWKLMDEFLIYMLSSVEGTRIVRYEEQNVVFELTSLYFHPTEAFKAKASTILADNNAELAGKELALGTAEGKGMNVYLVEEGADYTDADLIGRAPVSAVYNLVHDFTYRISNVSITSVSNSAKGGVTMDLGKVLCFGNRFEGIKPAAAKAFFDRTASANKKYPIALIGDATMETLQSTNKFIATNNSKGVTFFAIETADGLKAVAKSLVTVNLKEGVKIELDAQASDFTGDLTLYVYASSVVTK